MIYSPTSQYALRAMIHLASRPDERPVQVQEIAAAQRIPRQFLSKIMHDLRNKRLVKSTKGPGGGYALARKADLITIGEVVEAIDGVQEIDKKCILGPGECNAHHSCALHEPWKLLREEFLSSIGAMTLKQASRTLRKKS